MRVWFQYVAAVALLTVCLVCSSTDVEREPRPAGHTDADDTNVDGKKAEPVRRSCYDEYRKCGDVCADHKRGVELFVCMMDCVRIYYFAC